MFAAVEPKINRNKVCKFSALKPPNLVQTSAPKEHQSCSTRDHEILLEIQFSVEKVDF